MTNNTPYNLQINTLNQEWHDMDEVMLHACFQCLVDFIEKEEPDETINWDSDDGHSFAWQEMQHLYAWWKNERPLRDKLLDIDIPDDYISFEPADNNLCRMIFNDKKYPEVRDRFREVSQKEIEFIEEDTLSLKRLIDIRRYMWT